MKNSQSFRSEGMEMKWGCTREPAEGPAPQRRVDVGMVG